MSLGIAIKGPEGLVLAADSRLTLQVSAVSQPSFSVNFDNATKLFSFDKPNSSIGVVTYGLAAMGFRTAQSYMPEFENALPKKRLSVEDFSKRLSDFFLQQWSSNMPPDYQGPDMTFIVGGFNEDEPYGRVMQFDIPSRPSSFEQQRGFGEFGITWGGQGEIVNRLLLGYDPQLPSLISNSFTFQSEEFQQLTQALQPFQLPVPLQAMPLQDCVDLAIFLIRTTIDAQRLTVGLRGVGGPIDVATITRRDNLKFIQRKRITGESQLKSYRLGDTNDSSDSL